jgi:hypothetical protein
MVRMTRLLAAVLAVAVFTSPLASQSPTPAPVVVVPTPDPISAADPAIEVTIDAPERITPPEGFVVRYKATKDARLTWGNAFPVGASPPFRAVDENDEPMLVFVRSVPGQYRFRLTAQISVDKSEGYDPLATDEAYTDAGPIPPKPDPQPDPDPKPDPQPTPGKLTVLLLYEDREKPRYPIGQQQAIDSTAIRAYLDTHCDKEADGTPAYRIWDDDVNATNDSKWQALLAAAPRNNKPWLIINGVGMDLPATEEATLELLKKYGG